MKLDTVLVKVASRCNINCSYCYVYNMGDMGWTNMPAQISLETVEAIGKALQDFRHETGDRFSVVLHGGEPLLLGSTKLREILRTLRNSLPADYPIGLQTNGILISNEILDICSKFRCTVSISVDGPIQIHDKNRIGHDSQGTYDKMLRGLDLLRGHKDSNFVYSGILAVVDPDTNPVEIYDFLKTLSPPSIDFLYKDGNHSRLPIGKASFSSVEYGTWFVRLLDFYLSDPRPVPIRFLDDIIKLVLGGFGKKDGAGLTDYSILVVDSDGSIAKNDTLKSTFDGADRFIESWNIKTNDLTTIFRSNEFQEYHLMQQPTSQICKTCPELKVCGGGMTLHRWRNENGFTNPSVYCNDQKLLIRQVRNRLSEFRASA